MASNHGVEGYWFDLPEGWTERPLGELFDTQLGKMKATKPDEESSVFLKNRNVYWGELKLEELDEMFFSDAEKATYSLEPGDLLVTEGGEVGRCAIWNGEIANCYFQNSIHRVRPITEIPNLYLRLFLEYATKMPKFNRFVQQTSIAHLSQSNLRNIPVPLPDMPEYIQNGCQEISEITELIQIEKTELEKVMNIEQGLIEKLFEESNRNGWVPTTLGSIASIQTGPFGSQLHASDYVKLGTPILTVEHLGKNELFTEGAPEVGSEDYHRLNRYHLEEGDILFSRVGSIDRVGYVSSSEHGWMFSGRLLRVRLTSPLVRPKFLSWYLCSEDALSYIRRHAVGTTMLCLNTSILKNLPLYYPTQQVHQEEIEHILDEVRLNVVRSREVIEKLTMIREGMLTDFIEGRWPLK